MKEKFIDNLYINKTIYYMDNVPNLRYKVRHLENMDGDLQNLLRFEENAFEDLSRRHYIKRIEICMPMIDF